MRWFLISGIVATVAVWSLVIYLVRQRSERRGKPPRPPLKGAGRSQWALVLLLSAGAIQASPVLAFVPGRLALWLLAFLVIATFDAILWHIRARHPITIWPVVTALSITALGGMHASSADYGSTKVYNLLLTSFLVLMGGLLLWNEARRLRFLWWIVWVGLGALVLSLVAPSTDVAVGRAAAAGATTIATGRLAGAAVVVLVAWMISGRLRRPVVGLVAVTALAALMFETGSRGPLMAVGVTLVVMLAATFVRHPGRVVVVSVIAAGLARVAWAQASPVAQDRIRSLISGDRGASVSEREFMWSRSWEIAQDHLGWGLGWANLDRGELVVDQYPHNLFLEVLAEAGLLALGLLAALLVVGAVRATRARAADASALPLLGLLVFATANAMVSGDVTDNRLVFVIAAACWTLRSSARNADSAEEAPQAATAGMALKTA